jgi:hypothetical protein
MKTASFSFSVLLTSFALDSQSTEFYVGADLVPLNLWKQSKNFIICSNCKGVSDGTSNGTGFRVGMWIPNESIGKTGWEVGYDKLGNLSGSTEYSPQGCSMFFCSGPTATATWRHEAAIMHVDVLGTIPVSHSAGNNEALFGKIGLYKSTVKSEGNFGSGGGSYSRVVTGTGLLLGAGYLYPITPHLSARLASDFFLYTKVADPVNPGGTLSDIFVKVSLGMDLTF